MSFPFIRKPFLYLFGSEFDHASSLFFLALLVARAFNTVFCRTILGHGCITRPFGLRLRFNRFI